jgi:hypothetical protein
MHLGNLLGACKIHLGKLLGKLLGACKNHLGEHLGKHLGKRLGAYRKPLEQAPREAIEGPVNTPGEAPRD